VNSAMMFVVNLDTPSKIINLFNTGMATANNNDNYLLSIFPYNGSSRDKTTTKKDVNLH
jgi:hypothetical protein